MKDKLIVQGRVKNAGQGGNTPIPGSVKQGGAPDISGTRVKKGPGLPRKNDAPATAQSRMGLSMGSRVTSKETRKR